MGVTQHSQGSDTSTAISNLLARSLETTCVREPALIHCADTTTCRARATTGRCLTIFRATSRLMIRKSRARFEAYWKVKLPSTKGLDNHQMVDAIQQGKVKAMYLIGEEMSIVDSNANYVDDAFSKLEFFVVQEIFFGDVCQYADVGFAGNS